jgi:hypothetical protein
MPTRSDIARWTEITVSPAATGDTWDKVAQCKQGDQDSGLLAG